ncbi:MAG: hypothetical protein IJS40_05500 [Synergistaceae bacterium]|nr:hypothetical protein [Synergistaceae bacterium]
MFFISACGIAATLHNLGRALQELSTIAIKGGIEIYALLMILSGLLGLLGVWLMMMKKKTAAFYLMGAATICIAEYLFGLEPFYAFLWSFAYALAGAGCFYEINLGCKLPPFKFATRRQIIEDAIEQLSDTEKIIKDQKNWTIQVNEFMKNYGVLTYYTFLAFEILCWTMPILYFYRSMENLPTENIFHDSLIWALIIFAVSVGATEFQRKKFIDND